MSSKDQRVRAVAAARLCEEVLSKNENNGLVMFCCSSLYPNPSDCVELMCIVSTRILNALFDQLDSHWDYGSESRLPHLMFA
jgi:hypothetical protein